MSVLDTLEILIEADVRGLESQLRSGMEQVIGFINKMNSSEVNWTKILSESISPAIISGIASTFALAIAGAVQFQDKLINVSNSTASTAGQTNAQISDSVLGMGAAIGASAGDSAIAYTAFTKMFNSSTDASQAMTDAQNLAIAAHMTLGQVIQLIMPLFDNWGVTTLPQAEKAMTGLANAAGVGKFSLTELVDTISAGGATLRSSTDITTTSLQLQNLSNQAGETKSSTKDLFDSMLQYMAQPTNTITMMSGGVTGLGKTIESDGVMGAISRLGTTIENLGPLATGSMGVTTALFQDFGRVTDDVTKIVEEDTKKQIANLASLEAQAKKNTTTTQALATQWNIFTDKLLQKIGIPIITDLTTGLTVLNDLLSGQFKKAWSDFEDSIATSDVGTTLGNLGKLFEKLGTSSAFAAGGAAIGTALLPGIGTAAGLAGGAALGWGVGELDTFGKLASSAMSAGSVPQKSPVGGSLGPMGSSIQNNTFYVSASKGSEVQAGQSIQTQLSNGFNGLVSGLSAPASAFKQGSGIK